MAIKYIFWIYSFSYSRSGKLCPPFVSSTTPELPKTAFRHQYPISAALHKISHISNIPMKVLILGSMLYSLPFALSFQFYPRPLLHSPSSIHPLHQTRSTALYVKRIDDARRKEYYEKRRRLAASECGIEDLS